MLDFLLSLFNVWVWLGGGALAELILLIAYFSHGPNEYYEPFEYKDDGIVESIRVADKFKHISFKKGNEEWRSKINLRNYALKKAKNIILLIILPCMLIWSYKMNQVDHNLKPSETSTYKESCVTE